ncbi:transketolase [Rhizobium laguerreae]|nr:transketolase [Rhizobium laguerreae]
MDNMEMFSEMERRARNARVHTITSIHRNREGHYGGSLSCIEIMSVLYSCFIQRSRSDKFILSKGHAAAGYYAVLAECGLLQHDQLDSYAQFGSALQGHPDMLTCNAVDFSSGSLGQGLSVGLGMALAMRRQASHVWALLGDGECQEGQVWEAAMLAGRLQLNNLTAIIDANGYQEWGFRTGGKSSKPVPDLAEKWAAFGWNVVLVNGHDIPSLHAACSEARQTATGPHLILATTVKGHGVHLIAADPDRFHCGELSPTEYMDALGSLQ